MSATAFLLTRAPGDIVAIRGGRPASAAVLLAHADGIARLLPAGPVINACEDRYAFLAGFAAALGRGLPTLLPPNALPPTLDALLSDWPGSCVLADRPEVAAGGRRVLLAGELPHGTAVNPAVSGDALAVVAFTSGSTGESRPQRKSWRLLAESTALNMRYYLPAAGGPFGVVTTVPAQHMYGLEASVLPALRERVVTHHARPFFPVDVAAALAEAPAPRVLVTTPVHLRALVAAGSAFPPVARVVCATAPLEADLAARAEVVFGCELVEIYGCSEVGSMAARRTATEVSWRLFDGMGAVAADGGTDINAAHLPGAVRLPDVLEFGADGRFALAGRDADVVKVAGKRGSLAEITRLLLAVPGVADAAAFMPTAAPGRERVAALVVAPGLDAATVLAALRGSIDPVFLPRPLLMVPALPRAASGKLPRQELLGLYDAVRRGGDGS